MSIINDSPQLAYALIRRFSREDIELLEDAFNLASLHGGAKEMDFERKPEMLPSPRLARAALILINDANVQDPKLIGALFLTASMEHEKLPKATVEKFPDSLYELASLALLAPALLAKSSKPLRHEASLIALALRLDRARHIHLLDSEDKMKVWSLFLEETQDYISLAKKISTPVHNLFCLWKVRFQRKIANANNEALPSLAPNGEHAVRDVRHRYRMNS